MIFPEPEDRKNGSNFLLTILWKAFCIFSTGLAMGTGSFVGIWVYHHFIK